MFGLKLYQRTYVESLERELNYWRNRADAERDRADRLHDALMVRHGELPVTDIVRKENTVFEDHREEAYQKRSNELMEIFGEQMGEMEELDLLPELQKDAAEMIGEKA